MLICYTQAQKELPNAMPKSANQPRDTERKNRKGEKYRKHRLHRVKDGSCVANNTIRNHDSHPLQLKNQHDKVCSQSFFQLLCIA